jgi:hypothetical protein
VWDSECLISKIQKLDTLLVNSPYLRTHGLAVRAPRQADKRSLVVVAVAAMHRGEAIRVEPRAECRRSYLIYHLGSDECTLYLMILRAHTHTHTHIIIIIKHMTAPNRKFAYRDIDVRLHADLMHRPQEGNLRGRRRVRAGSNDPSRVEE